MKRVRVVLADDHEMIREGLKALVESQSDMEVVGEAATGRSAVALSQQLQPDVVVMDVSMPELNGLKATEQLTRLYPQVKIVALTRHRDYSYWQELFRAGASAYVLKKSASEELVRAIRAVVADRTYLDPGMIEQAIATVARRRPTSRTAEEGRLSSREQDVLRHTALGYANKEIADRLSISVKTVEAHKANAMSKMGMKNRIDIVRYAFLRGWFEDT
jgi:DNA-binding NarL/FixJ family response regulator